MDVLGPRAAKTVLLSGLGVSGALLALPLVVELIIGTEPVNVAKNQTPEEHKASKAAARAELDRRSDNRDKIMMAAERKVVDARAADREAAKRLRMHIRHQEEIKKYAVPRLTGPHPRDAKPPLF
jgi:hypothetical protein